MSGVLVATALVAVLAGCGAGDAGHARAGCPPSPSGAPRVLNATDGTYGDARLGTTRLVALRSFKRLEHQISAVQSASLSGCGEGELGGVELPEPLRSARFRSFTLTFGGRPSRLVEIATDAQGSRTDAGAGIGDTLEDVRRIYPAATCGKEIGDNGPLWPSCHVITRSARMYFGGDPITTITLRARP